MNDYLFAHALATANADQQAAFLNEFYRMLKVVCKERHETQLAYIADHLDENGRELCASLHEFAKLVLESRAKREVEMVDLYHQKHELEKEVDDLRQQRATVKELLAMDTGKREVTF